MPDRCEELRTARKEGTPPHPPPKTSNDTPDRFDELRTARREGRPVHQPNSARKREEAEERPVENYSRPLRRQRASSIPRAKRTTADSEAEAWNPSVSRRRATPSAIVKVSWNAGDTTDRTIERPLSPLVPPPLQLSPSKVTARRAIDTIVSPASDIEDQARCLPLQEKTDQTNVSKVGQPRSFSFDDKPEVITFTPKSHHLQDQQDVQPTVQEDPAASKPLTISNLRDSLKRDGTVRRRLQKPNPALAENQGAKPTLRESTGSLKGRLSISKPNPVPAVPKISKQTLRESTGSLKHRLSVSKIPNPSFQAAKSFWNRIASSSSSGSSSIGAVINGKEDEKPECVPPVPVDRKMSLKTSKVSELAKDTANAPTKAPSRSRSRRRLSKPHPMRAQHETCTVLCEQVAHITPAPSAALYHVTETQKGGWVSHRAVVGDTSSRFHAKSGSQDSGSSISGSSGSSSSQHGKGPLGVSNRDRVVPCTPRLKHQSIARVALENTSTPSLQAQLFEDVIKLCTPEKSGSCLKDCVCDNCKWSGLNEVDRSSMVAVVDGGRGRRW